MELRRRDRVRFTRNDPASGLTNGETATVDSIDRDGIRLRLGNGTVIRLGNGDPQLRHIDRAFAATVHAFQGRTGGRGRRSAAGAQVPAKGIRMYPLVRDWRRRLGVAGPAVSLPPHRPGGWRRARA